MGAWGNKIYQNDTAMDIKDSYKKLLQDGKSTEEAYEEMFESYSDVLSSEYIDDIIIFYLSFADTLWNYGRLTANGWKNATARVQSNDVQPGDLVFFQGTYNTSGASHVGIVVDPVNKIMIHCGNPIQYASYDTTYWRAHAYCYGRLP